MNKRRKLVMAFAAATIALPLRSRAQQPRGKPRRIGYLTVNELASVAAWLAAFKESMLTLGYQDGRDYEIEHRSAKGDVKRFPSLATELLALKVDLIIAAGTPQALAAKEATRDLPILLVTVSDPVRSGIVSSFAHPGANITGIATLSAELIDKKIQLLLEMVPRGRKVGFFYNPEAVNDKEDYEYLRANANKLNLRVVPAPAKSESEIGLAFESLVNEKVNAVFVTLGANVGRGMAIAQEAAKRRLPAIYGNVRFVEAGGLLSYAPDWSDQYRRLATYVHKIFKGVPPADIPIEQPTKFELAINLKAANDLKLKIPNSILVRADKVIE